MATFYLDLRAKMALIEVQRPVKGSKPPKVAVLLASIRSHIEDAAVLAPTVVQDASIIVYMGITLGTRRVPFGRDSSCILTLGFW